MMDKFSYTHSKFVAKREYTTIPSLLDRRAKETPHKVVNIIRNLNPDRVTVGREALTFSQLAENSLKLAASLLALGLKPRDRIAVIGPCCSEYLYLEYACQRIAVLMIRIPEVLASSDVVVNILKKYRVKAFIVENNDVEKKLNTLAPSMFSDNKHILNEQYGIEDLEYCFFLRKNGTEHHRSIRELTEVPGDEARVRDIQDSLSPDDPSVAFATSGSTGTPKILVISHTSLLWAVTDYIDRCHQQHAPDFVYMSDRSPSGLLGMTMLSTFLGSTTVYLDPSISKLKNGVSIYAKVTEEEHVTSVLYLNYVLYDMKNAPQEEVAFLASALKTVATGGELVPIEISDFARHSFDNFAMLYGSTECCFNSFSGSDDDWDWMEPAASTEFKVTNDDGKVLPRGVMGNISVRSPSTMLGYLEDEIATNTVLSRSGWYSTGDIGIIREDGRLKVTGRTKDVISKGGKKVYPKQVETILEKHPGVFRVVAIAVPDPRLFNEVCVCVIPKRGESVTEGDLRSFSEAQFMADDAVALPRYYLILEEYQTLSSGKVDKGALRKMAITSFNLA